MVPGGAGGGDSLAVSPVGAGATTCSCFGGPPPALATPKVTPPTTASNPPAVAPPPVPPGPRRRVADQHVPCSIKVGVLVVDHDVASSCWMAWRPATGQITVHQDRALVPGTQRPSAPSRSANAMVTPRSLACRSRDGSTTEPPGDKGMRKEGVQPDYETTPGPGHQALAGDDTVTAWSGSAALVVLVQEHRLAAGPRHLLTEPGGPAPEPSTCWWGFSLAPP